ncbi:GH92 family glycosyl hydrolase [Limibacter armeniacum]|uniref:GH92 family glycosyl hydrolase n=1 Tax=Limibacter armeniacum TaxID=466084 RepID=UPI002FE6509F
MKRHILTGWLLLLSYTLMGQQLTDYVNPFIGSSNYGATNPGAIVPRGMVSVVPFNTAGKQNKLDKDSDWVSFPYLHENTFFTGFSHVNLSGVGCPDLGVLLLMPTTGELSASPEVYGSTYTHEQAHPAYYSNILSKYNIKTEVTATQRTGISRFTFPAGKSNVLLNLGQGLTNESGAMYKVVSDSEVEGMRMVGGFCYNNSEAAYPVYFVMKVSKPADRFGGWTQHKKIEGIEANWAGSYNGKVRWKNEDYSTVLGDSIGVYFSYDFEEQTQVEVKVGVSYVSIENARENLQKEVGEQTFDLIHQQGQKAWEKALSSIKVEGGTKDDKTIFYTALYHTLIHPNVFNDVNGEYLKVGSHQTGNSKHDRYTVFSLWDTYRCMNQLMTLLYPEQQLDMVRSMLEMYDENGWLPKWELNSTETFTMVGDPAAAVIADTYTKGLHDFNAEKAMEAMLKSAYKGETETNPLRPGIADYEKHGYLPADLEIGKDAHLHGTVSTTLEYCIADFGIAQMAKAMGKENIYKEFIKRSRNYQNLYDKQTGLFRPKMANGEWHTPFDPKAGANFQANVGYIEGNAWQYSMMAPHDMPNVVKLMGGKKKFINHLQSLFDTEEFDMANEPDINYPFCFNYVKGEEHRTQTTVRNLIRKHFTNQPAGLPGNDDTGTMSAWLVFSMMGLYPDAPGVPHYTLSAPFFDKVTIQLSEAHYGGKVIEITADKSGENGVIQTILLNGKPYRNYFISHQELVNGANLHFDMKSSAK